MIQENISRWLMETSTKLVNESTLSFARARRSLRCFVLSKILFRKFIPETDFEKFEEGGHLSRVAAQSANEKEQSYQFGPNFCKTIVLNINRRIRC